MQCSHPPPLTDEQISAGIDGVWDDEIAQHAAQCPWCAARLSQATALEQRLGVLLRRWDCPPSEQLREYHFGLLAPVAHSELALHLHACLSCATELAELQSFLSDDRPALHPEQAPRPPRPLGARLYELVAQLLPRSAVSVRGMERQPLIATAGDLSVLLDVEVSDGERMLLGQLLAGDPEHWIGALVEMRQADTLVATATLDDLGGFRCTLPSPAAVSVRITAAGRSSLVIPDVALNP